ncbi:MAG: hypothetical protein RQ833_02890 [Sphingomonadaceae bacterium]|nr:hypothetical protein [Sphingomonadaceae bacterium]
MSGSASRPLGFDLFAFLGSFAIWAGAFSIMHDGLAPGLIGPAFLNAAIGTAVASLAARVSRQHRTAREGRFW